MLENIRKRDRKSVKILAVVTVISFVCCITLIMVAAQKPDSPEFCARCHSMEPSYNTWKETISCNTGCLDCHTHDGSGRTLSVEIQDSNCTSTGCHPVEELTSQPSAYKEVFVFNHKTHLKEYPTNLKLRCIGCHSYMGREVQEGVETKHFGIDENACFVCHFIKGETPLLTTKDKKEVDGCSLCHKDVQLKIMIYEKEFDHLKYEKKLKVECTNCHFETIHRGNDVGKKDCYYCHTKIPEEYKSADRMHNDHVAEHKVPCSPCHDGISHKWGDEYIYNILPERDIEAKDKNLMRASGTVRVARSGDVTIIAKDEKHILGNEPYLLQREVYAGNGGRGVERSPDPMYLATVNCTACHKDKELAVDPKICNTCHEKGFDKTMAEQKEYITRMLNSLSDLLIESQKHGVPEALIDGSRYNYDLIVRDGSFGVHNIKYVKDLINYSIQRLE
jgi:nitrate/TMAO reductase-like tetraheme cytochrome c subunit